MYRKEKLYRYCQTLLKERVEQAQKAMDAAQKDANSETKSSAGDKYETGRAMAHLDKEMHMKTHARALEDLYKLETIGILAPAETISIGSLVSTNIGSYFITVGLGVIQLEGQRYKVISANSPMGQTLLGLEEEEEIAFRDFEIIIELIE